MDVGVGYWLCLGVTCCLAAAWPGNPSNPYRIRYVYLGLACYVTIVVGAFEDGMFTSWRDLLSSFGVALFVASFPAAFGVWIFVQIVLAFVGGGKLK